MDVCCEVSCVVRYRSLRRTDHSSRGVLPSVVCVTEGDLQPPKKKKKGEGT
jgi:hypothetical protein